MSALRRGLLACALMLAALPAQAETLADTMVAAYRHSALLDQNRALLRAADRALYRAKHEGRGTWRLAEDPGFPAAAAPA